MQQILGIEFASPETGLSSGTLEARRASGGLRDRATLLSVRLMGPKCKAPCGRAWKGRSMNFPALAGVRNAALVLVCSLYCALAQGQNANPAASGTDNAALGTALEPIVITATRTAQPLDRTGSSMSVISADDLATQQLAFVSDALAQTPGLSVTREGGPGQLTSTFIRGAETGESVTLIDGIRINDPSAPDGAPVLGDLLVNNIDRIEVLRGPQSTLYGSDAIGGVVNILTQRGGAQPFVGTLEAQGGTYDTYRLNGAAHGSIDALEYG